MKHALDPPDASDQVYERLLRIATTTSDGAPADPRTPAEWQGWVEDEYTCNWVRGNPLIDYLDLCRGIRFDPDDSIPGYDPRFDLGEALKERSRVFQRALIAELAERHEVRNLGDVSSWGGAAKRATLRAMAESAPVIAYGELWNPDTKLWARAGLIVRSDVAATDPLFAAASQPQDDLHVRAPNLGAGDCHYRVVTFVDASMAQFFKSRSRLCQLRTFVVKAGIAHATLGRLQGYRPAYSYLLGTDWRSYGPALVDHSRDTLEAALAAAGWIRTVRADGMSWTVLPRPSQPELYPNMRDRTPSGWNDALKEIATELAELTLIPYVTPDARMRAHAAGITRWDDPRLTTAILGLPPGRRSTALVEAILKAQRPGVKVLPAQITRADPAWRTPAPVEVFVALQSLETNEGGSLVYMINWLVRRPEGSGPCWLVASAPTMEGEADLFERWRKELKQLARAQGVRLNQVRLYRWHTPGPIPPLGLNWYDLYDGLVRKEPVTVNRALSFSLPAMAEAMEKLGLIHCAWPHHPASGAEAMAAALTAADEVGGGVPFASHELIQPIAAFGSAHCEAMAQILDYLRANH